jgi:hypothetical protein
LPGDGYEQDQNAMRLNSLMVPPASQTSNPLSLRKQSKCNCKKTPLLDELGHHISTACGQGDHQIMTHDSVKCQILHQRSPKQLWYQNQSRSSRIFQSGHPREQPAPIYEAPDFNKPVVADVCITCPIPVAASAPLLITGRAAGIAKKGKETKYKAACDANGLEL